MATHVHAAARDTVGGRPQTVAATSDRLLGERLEQLMRELTRTDGRLPAETIATLARLVSAVSALREMHAVDPQGRCGLCHGPSRWPQRRQPCSVYDVLDQFLR
jgi:hypothetical protein